MDRRWVPQSGARDAMIWIGIAVLALTIGMALGGTPTTGSRAGPASAPHAPILGVATSGAREVAAAQHSLATGHGPAAIAGSCGVQVGRAFPCSRVVPPLGPRPASGSPTLVWTNLTSKLAGNYPSNRWLASMAYDPVDGYVVLFGGYAGGGTYGGPFSDTWAFSNGMWNQLSPSNVPTGRYAGTMTWDAKDGYLVMFSGYTTTAVLNDTWSFLHGQWTDMTNSSDAPAGRWRAVMAYDPVDQYVVMFGGTNLAGGVFSDTWSYSGGIWTNLTKVVKGSPPGHFRAEATWDASDGYLVMFGGCTASSCPTSDTWEYVNKNWTSVTPTTRPSARTYIGITYDGTTRNVTLFGGTDQATNFYSDTWQFHNGTWTSLSETRHPGGRAYTAMTYDSLDGFLVLFGGAPASAGGYQNDTWVFGPSVLATLRVSPAAIDLGQTIMFNATPLSFSGFVRYSWGSLPGGCSAGNISVVSCTPNATGTFPVNVTETDSTGSPTLRNTTIVVSGDPGIVSFTTNRATVTASTSVDLNVTMNGQGTLPYTYSYAQLPLGCTSANVSSIACSPGRPGQYWVNLTVIDMAGWAVHASLNLTVNPRPAVLAFTTSAPTIDAGMPVTFYTNATGGTAPLTYRYSGLPSPCVTANVSALLCTPNTASGLTTVLVVVTDVFGWNASASTTVTVNPGVVVAPLGLSSQVIDAHQQVTFWLNASGGTGGLSYAYSGLPAGCTLSSAARTSCAPTGTGNFSILGSVRDSLGETVSVSANLTVHPDPNITALALTPTSTDANGSVNVSTSVSGGTQPFTYAYSGLPKGCVGADTPTFVCVPTAVGSFAIRVSVTDAVGRTSSLSAMLRINPYPSVQSFTVSDPTVTTGTAVSFAVSASGGTGGLTYSYSGLPAGCSSSNTTALTCTPTATGAFNVVVTAKDALGHSGMSTTTLTVTAASSASGGPFGLSGGTAYLLIGVLAAVVVVGVAVALIARRRRPGPGPPAPWSEEEPPAEPSS